MPSIAQQDYKIIAPKQGRVFVEDAAALGELKKAILNGIGFDCIIKDTVVDDGDFNRVLGLYPNGTLADIWSKGDDKVLTIEMPHTVIQYQGLAAVQQALDEKYGLQEGMTYLTTSGAAPYYLQEDSEGRNICIDGKFLFVEFSGEDKIGSLTIAETGPGEGDSFVNITWEDAQKLIGLPLT